MRAADLGLEVEGELCQAAQRLQGNVRAWLYHPPCSVQHGCRSSWVSGSRTHFGE
jgi:hypothetical protein